MRAHCRLQPASGFLAWIPRSAAMTCCWDGLCSLWGRERVETFENLERGAGGSRRVFSGDLPAPNCYRADTVKGSQTKTTAFWEVPLEDKRLAHTWRPSSFRKTEETVLRWRIQARWSPIDGNMHLFLPCIRLEFGGSSFLMPRRHRVGNSGGEKDRMRPRKLFKKA